MLRRNSIGTRFCMNKSFLYIGLLLIGVSANAADNNAESLQGPTFSDHMYIKPMKQAWVDKTVTYDEKNQDADLVLSLGQQSYPALHELIEEMAGKRGVKVKIEQGSCGKTAKKIKRKEIDIGAYCCPPMKGDRLPGLEFHTIGIAAVSFVTHTSNPLKNISSMEAQNIFRGEYMMWSEVPSAQKVDFTAGAIQPVVRLHCKKRPGHWRHLLKNEDLMSPRLFEVGVIPDMIQQVANEKLAIGIETVFMLEVHKEYGEVNVLTVDGHHPSQGDFVLNGEYPIYRTLNLTTWQGEGKNYKLANEFVQEIIHYIESNGNRYGIIAPSKLKKSGWKFHNNELISEPDGMPVIHQHEHEHIQDSRI